MVQDLEDVIHETNLISVSEKKDLSSTKDDNP